MIILIAIILLCGHATTDAKKCLANPIKNLTGHIHKYEIICMHTHDTINDLCTIDSSKTPHISKLSLIGIDIELENNPAFLSTTDTLFKCINNFTNLQILIIYNVSNLNKIPIDLPPSLYHLSITNNQDLTILPRTLLSKLNGLLSLDLSSNNIPNLAHVYTEMIHEAVALKNPPQIIDLSLSHSNITTILLLLKSLILDSPNLQSLALSGNTIDGTKASDFTGLNQLTFLSMGPDGDKCWIDSNIHGKVICANNFREIQPGLSPNEITTIVVCSLLGLTILLFILVVYIYGMQKSYNILRTSVQDAF